MTTPPLIAAQYLVAGAFFGVSVLHAFVWLGQRRSITYLLFAATALTAGGNAIAESCVYQARTIEAVAPALRWYVTMSGFWAISLIWFIYGYTGLSRLGRWLAVAVSVELVIALMVNFVSSSSFIYTEITGIRQIDLPWGEVISLAEGHHRSWPLAAEVTLVAAIVIVVDGSRRFWCAGQRRRAYMFGTTCILFMILFGSHATLVDMGILNSPYLSTYGFLGVVLVISLDMARDVVRASELSQELQQKEAEKHAAVNDERNRIASDLHDSVTQTLFSTAAIADALPDVWDRYPDEARRGLEDLRRLTKSALAEMRSLLLELHPTSLLEKDLGDLLEQLADAAVARTRIQVRTDVKGIQELPDQVKIALYRVAQEALNNAIKHAEASSVTLSLAWEAERLVLGVTDDGLGFDPESLKPGRLGIEIMRERIRSIGADLNIRTKPGMGTTVRVEWHDDRLGGLDG